MIEANSKPLYQPWREEAFRADERVYAMNPVQRWIYRTLLQAGFICSTRPYLPDDDGQLWMLAGCESRQQWEQNKDVVRAMFTPVEQDGIRLLSQKRLLADWTRLEEKRQMLAENGRKGRKAQLRSGNSNTDGQQMSGNCPSNDGQSNSTFTSLHFPSEETGKREKRATPILDSFDLDAEMILFANEHGIDPQYEFAKFRDHHKKHGNIFKDWKAAWRNWVRKAAEFSGGAKGVSQQMPQRKPMEVLRAEP